MLAGATVVGGAVVGGAVVGGAVVAGSVVVVVGLLVGATVAGALVAGDELEVVVASDERRDVQLKRTRATAGTMYNNACLRARDVTEHLQGSRAKGSRVCAIKLVVRHEADR